MVYRAFQSENFSDLDIDVSALYLIAKPSIPEPVRAQIVTRAENGEKVTYSGARALVQHFTETGEMPDIEVDLPKMIADERRRCSPSEKPGAKEQEELKAFRARRDAGTAHVVKVMTVVQSIERIAKSELSMPEIAKEIDKLDTPDKDWHGQAKQAHTLLGKLCREFDQ